MSIALGGLIKEQKSELKDVVAGLVEGKTEKVAGALATLVLGVATGHPELAVLAPFLQEGARRAFSEPATRRLEKALADAKVDEDRAAFLGQIAEATELLLGQSLVQMVRVQHRAKDEVIEALGGLRQDLAGFREEFQDRLDASGLTLQLAQRRVTPHTTLLDLGPLVGRIDDLAAIERALADPGKPARLVLAGDPGIGKTHLANGYGASSRALYPGGTFLVRFNVDPALELAKLVEPLGEERIADRAQRALGLLSEPTLLVYDNVPSEAELCEWLPPAGLPVHVLVTTTSCDWTRLHAVHYVEPLGEADARALIINLSGDDAARKYGDAIIRRAGGIAVQLKADAVFVEREVRHRREPKQLASTLAASTVSSFELAFAQLTADGQLAARVASRFNESSIPFDQVERLFEGEGWDHERVQRALDEAIDRTLIADVNGVLRMHGLVADFCRGLAAPPIPEGLGARHLAAFVEAARAFGARPGDMMLRQRWAAYPEGIVVWDGVGLPAIVQDLHWVGHALLEAGRFQNARPWFERAVTAAEKGDIHGRVDNESLGTSLHQVGVCFSRLGQFAEAHPWFERAIAAATNGDIHGRVDYENVGRSLHQAGLSFLSLGQFAEARPWSERAVAAKEKGDIHGRVDDASLGASLHQVGFCFSRLGQFAEARSWFERAVAAAEKGDIHGRFADASLGASLHQVGFCFFRLGQFAEARPWFERAVAAAEKGDIHGRIHHQSLGTSLHQVGFCFSSLGQFAEARPWFERAVAAAEKGDIHGRVDHQSVGTSLHEVGVCFSSLGQFAEARPWSERALAAAQKGDVHGRVDHQSVGANLHQVGFCFSSLGQFAEARPWFERAVAAKEKGDIHGRVDHQSVGTSLHEVGVCFSSLGQFAEARPWSERALAAAQKGDVHGRVDHESLGAGLHLMGFCFSHLGEFAEARLWFERAVAAAQKGDIHGRVNHESVGKSLHEVGVCFSSLRQFAEARPWFERAGAAKEEGDIRGRVDHESLGKSLHEVGQCLSSLGQPAEAHLWFERAVAAKDNDMEQVGFRPPRYQR